MARRVGRAGPADEDHHVERAEGLGCDVGQTALGHTLVGRAEVFADVGLKVVDALVKKRAGHGRWRPLLAGEQPHRLAAADLVDDPLDRLAGEIGEEGLLPGFLHPGEGELHAADMRHHLEPILPEAAADIAGSAVEQWIARGQDDEFLRPCGLDPVAELLEVGRRFQPSRQGRRQQSGARLRAEKQVGRLEHPPGLRGHSLDAVIPDADDVHPALGHAPPLSVR